jgi:hypothetical protein
VFTTYRLTEHHTAGGMSRWLQYLAELQPEMFCEVSPELACEVACKEWNHNPRDGDLELLRSSYDKTGALGASTWRHAAFIEQGRERIDQARETGRALVSLGMPGLGAPAAADPAAVSTAPPDTAEFRWLMSSDVCKHCTQAGCLDVCPLARCSAPSSAPSWCKPMSATGAAPAWPAVRSASSSAAATARPPRRASAVSGEADKPRSPVWYRPEVHAVLRPDG